MEKLFYDTTNKQGKRQAGNRQTQTVLSANQTSIKWGKRCWGKDLMKIN